MKITVEKLEYGDTHARFRLESENQTESRALIVLGKRVKKKVETWGLIANDRTVLDIRIPVRKQKTKDDEFGN